MCKVLCRVCDYVSTHPKQPEPHYLPLLGVDPRYEYHAGSAWLKAFLIGRKTVYLPISGGSKVAECSLSASRL